MPYPDDGQLPADLTGQQSEKIAIITVQQNEGVWRSEPSISSFGSGILNNAAAAEDADVDSERIRRG